MDKAIKILIVEDNLFVQQTMLATLSGLNIKVEVDFASDGKTAIEKYTPDYQLILMDMHLPDMNGLQVTRKIRKMEQALNCRTPIVATTSFHDELGFDEKCQAADMDACFGKPNSAQMQEILTKYVRMDCFAIA